MFNNNRFRVPEYADGIDEGLLTAMLDNEDSHTRMETYEGFGAYEME